MRNRTSFVVLAAVSAVFAFLALRSHGNDPAPAAGASDRESDRAHVRSVPWQHAREAPLPDGLVAARDVLPPPRLDGAPSGSALDSEFLALDPSQSTPAPFDSMEAR